MATLLLTPPVIFLFVSGLRRYRETRKSRGRQIKKKKAASKFYNGMRALKGPDQLSGMLKHASLYFNERLGLSGGSLTSTEVYDILLQNGIKEPSAADLRQAFSRLETALYAGREETTLPKEMKEELLRVVKKLDKELP